MQTTPIIYTAIAITLLIVLNYASRNWKRWYYRNDAQFEVPATPRKDFEYCYYGCLDDQVNETRSHVTMLMESQFQGLDKAIENMKSFDGPCMLDISPQLFTTKQSGQYQHLLPNADESLRALFRRLQQYDVLKHIKVIYLIDEPNNTVGDEQELIRAVNIARYIAGLFMGIDGYKLATIYAADKPFIAASHFDWIGFDDYDMKSNLMNSKKYRDMVDGMTPEQRTIIVPGVAYQQDPLPFVHYAQGHSEVAMVMPFEWFNDLGGSVGAQGARSNGNADKCIYAGLTAQGRI